MNKTSKIAVLALVVVLVLVVLSFKSSSVTTVVEKVGATPGNKITESSFSVGGVSTYSKSGKFNLATTTVLALRAPLSATSTLTYNGGCTFDVSSTTATTIYVAKSNTAFATSTLLRQESVSANAKAAFQTASTTYNSLADTNRTFSPGQYLVIGLAGGTGGTQTFSPIGGCTAEFVVARPE